MKHYTGCMPSEPPGVRSRPGDGVTHNLFFGLVPDPVTRERMAGAVARLRAQHEAPGRWLGPDRYHMTLHFLGNFQRLQEDLVDAARHAAALVRAPPFDIVLDQAGAFPRNRVGWLGMRQANAGLHGLWDSLSEALARVQVRMDRAPHFKPHVTVLRDAREALPVQQVDPIVWPVREFVLIDSQLGRHNAYVPMGSWRLSAE